jgi:hypothetical protein
VVQRGYPATRNWFEVGGGAGLAEAGDLLEFVHGQLVLLEQRHDAQARRIGKGAEGFQRGRPEIGSYGIDQLRSW